MAAARWITALAVASSAACVVGGPDTEAIRAEVERSVHLVEPEISFFDGDYGEPAYQATTLDACFEDDLYETRSYDVSGVPVDLDELRVALENQGWDMSEDTHPFAGSSVLLRGSTRRDSDAIDIHVATHGSPPTSLSVDLMFRSVAASLC